MNPPITGYLVCGDGGGVTVMKRRVGKGKKKTRKNKPVSYNLSSTST